MPHSWAVRRSATMSSAGSGTTKAARKLAIPRDRLKTSVTGRAANLRRSVTAYSLGSKNAKLDDPTLSHRERQRRYRDRIRPDRRADRGRRHRDDHIGRYKLDQHVQHSRQQPVRAGPVVRRASREGGELGVIHGVAGRFSAVGAAAAPAGRPRNAIPCWPVPIAWCSARAFDVSTARRSAAAASQEPRPDGSRAGWRLRQSHHLAPALSSTGDDSRPHHAILDRKIAARLFRRFPRPVKARIIPDSYFPSMGSAFTETA